MRSVGRRLHRVRSGDVEEDGRDLVLVRAEEGAQPRRRLQRDARRQGLGLVGRVAEEEQRDVAGPRVAVGPHLADVERVVALTRAS